MRWSFLASAVSLGSVACVAFGALTIGCGDDAATSTPDDTSSSTDDAGAPSTKSDAATDANANQPASCPRKAVEADHARKVVISHPFAATAGQKAKLFEVLELSAAGVLSKTNETFEMGVGYAEIAFTPDGKVGIVAQDDGTLGVFTFDDAGKVKVVHPAFKGAFYADQVVISRDGTRVYALDGQTENNGGGVYELEIGCDGTLTDKGLVVPGANAHAMALVPNDPDRAVLIAYKALGSPANTYAHRLDLSGAAPSLLASGDAFGDTDAIASWVSVTTDGKYALVTDNGFSAGSRMVPIALDTMKPLALIATPNPVGVVMSPFGNAALLLNSDGEDHLRVVSYDAANKETPFALGSEVTYVGGKTQLPGFAFAIDRGTLKGRVLVSELQEIRQLDFAADGSVKDSGIFSVGEGSPSIVGSFGVQP